MESLIKIQHELKAPKNQLNKFGNYKYRSCEDILEALKPLLVKHNCNLTISDEIKEAGNIIYIEAQATIKDKDNSVSVKAQAGIDVNTKGMSIAQCFGSSSSYARKYALNGLFLIDDTKDDDFNNTVNKNISVENSEDLTYIQSGLNNCKTLDDIKILYDSLEDDEKAKYKALFTKRRLQIDKK